MDHNESSRAYVHEIRNRVMGIMVGIETVLVDNPRLTTRLKDRKGKDPIRIIVDSKARIPIDAKVINKDFPQQTILATTELAEANKLKELNKLGVEIIKIPSKNNKVDLEALIEKLGERGIDSILLEGGSTLAYSALKVGVVDKVYQFIAPKIIGGINAYTSVGGDGIKVIEDAIRLHNMSIKQFEEDVLIEGYIRMEDD